jgi:hypothetical protein
MAQQRNYRREYQARQERARALGWRGYWQHRQAKRQSRNQARLRELAASINELYGQSASDHIYDFCFRDKAALGKLLQEARAIVGNDVWSYWLTTHTIMRPYKALCLMRYPPRWDSFARGRDRYPILWQQAISGAW